MQKKFKIGQLIALVVTLLLVAGVGGVAYWQRGNIEALIYSLQYSEEERKEMGNKKEAELLQKISEEMPQVQVKPLTEEEEKMLKEGTISQEEALEIIMGESIPTNGQPVQEQPQSTQKPEPEPEPTASPEPDTSRLKSLLAQVYLMKSNFVGQIDGIIDQAKQEYIAAYQADKKTANKFAIGKKYIGQVAALETQCDAQLESLLVEIKAELEKTGGDTGLIQQIRSAYQEEKKAKKAQVVYQYYD